MRLRHGIPAALLVIGLLAGSLPGAAAEWDCAKGLVKRVYAFYDPEDGYRYSLIVEAPRAEVVRVSIVAGNGDRIRKTAFQNQSITGGCGHAPIWQIARPKEGKRFINVLRDQIADGAAVVRVTARNDDSGKKVSDRYRLKDFNMLGERVG